MGLRSLQTDLERCNFSVARRGVRRCKDSLGCLSKGRRKRCYVILRSIMVLAVRVAVKRSVKAKKNAFQGLLVSRVATPCYQY